MFLLQKEFSKYLIVFEIFAMFWFSELGKKRSQNSFFWNSFVLKVDTTKLHQTVGNCISNVIASKRFFKMFDSFWVVCHV